jgi:hypothetical protein
MLKATRLDRLIQEHNQYRQLLNSLTNEWLSYASHKETGLVYDKQVIAGHIERLSKEIEILEQELEES